MIKMEAGMAQQIFDDSKVFVVDFTMNQEGPVIGQFEVISSKSEDHIYLNFYDQNAYNVFSVDCSHDTAKCISEMIMMACKYAKEKDNEK